MENEKIIRQINRYFKYRINFEPNSKTEKGEKIEYDKEVLTSDIKKLSDFYKNKTDFTDVLYACYGVRNDDNYHYDIENVLFYNIGTSKFKNLVKNGLVFEKCKYVDDSNEGTHYYHYKMLDSFPDRKNGKEIDFSINPKSLSSSNKTECYFKLVREELKNKDVNFQISSPFGIALNIEGDINSRINIATSMKSLLDGIICAFHGFENIEVNGFRPEYKELYDKYSNDNINVLGKRKLIYKYKNGIKWDPADDLCHYVKIQINKNSNDKKIKIEGKLFEL